MDSPAQANKKKVNTMNFFTAYALPFRVALVTASAIILFRAIGLLVMYRYLKMDYYLCLVACCFLAAGLLINKRRSPIGHPPADAPERCMPPGDLLAVLTGKEMTILRLLAEGRTNKEIAAAQFVELSTVKTHVNNIYAKLAVANRNQARSKYAEMTQKFPVL